jgi:hypothetical protein
MLKRLGTIQVESSTVGAVSAYLPKGLEECVLTFGEGLPGDALAGEGPSGEAGLALPSEGLPPCSEEAASCLRQFLDVSGLCCRCLHICLPATAFQCMGVDSEKDDVTRVFKGLFRKVAQQHLRSDGWCLLSAAGGGSEFEAWEALLHLGPRGATQEEIVDTALAGREGEAAVAGTPEALEARQDEEVVDAMEATGEEAVEPLNSVEALEQLVAASALQDARRLSVRPWWLSAAWPAESTPLVRPLPFY